jgi:hypothetical protein
MTALEVNVTEKLARGWEEESPIQLEDEDIGGKSLARIPF